MTSLPTPPTQHQASSCVAAGVAPPTEGQVDIIFDLLITFRGLKLSSSDLCCIRHAAHWISGARHLTRSDR